MFRRDRNAAKAEITKITGQIDTLINRIMDTTSDKLVTSYEKRIEELEQKKLILSDKASQKPDTSTQKLNSFQAASEFLAKPAETLAF